VRDPVLFMDELYDLANGELVEVTRAFKDRFCWTLSRHHVVFRLIATEPLRRSRRGYGLGSDRGFPSYAEDPRKP
jgi:hypothetical protein